MSSAELCIQEDVVPFTPTSAADPGGMLPPLLAGVLREWRIHESADAFARRCGWRNRHDLNRTLHRAGLPAWHVLAELARILEIRDAAVEHHRSITYECWAHHTDPAWFYRSVKRISGVGWSECRSLSNQELLVRVCA